MVRGGELVAWGTKHVAKGLQFSSSSEKQRGRGGGGDRGKGVRWF